MDESSEPRFTRRRALIGLAVGAVAGCTSADTADGGAAGGTPTSDGSGEDLPGGTDGIDAGTSLAGSCGSVFGDTDERNTGPVAVATFADPMGGTVDHADESESGTVLSVGYPGPDADGYHSLLTVAQRRPSGGDAARRARYLEVDRYVDGGTVRYDGSERTVAVLRYDAGEIRLFGVAGPDGASELEAKAPVSGGDPCPEAYTDVTERVSRSFRPASPLRDRFRPANRP
ncbi:hypothetical protein [Halorientalis regularis]|jgi:hypothetical protein|uniref:Uncharacterized protein n=1 Tax=Halorientalis regularis TaxID=660518 RepID=A0A1G7MFU4_9EURY|nr:hypothetical protein [Halorientalis regularis]SDF60060.1 hypothetical protein SAMN05216218_107238 [Halorientalis regularis]